MRTILFAVGIALLSLGAPAEADSDEAIRVNTSAELIAALGPHNAGRHIRMEPGEYAIDHPLTVPDGAFFEGSGVMRMDNGLPAGFEPGSFTTIQVASRFEGDLLTLGNGVVLRGLRLEDLSTVPGSSPQRTGNVIVVGSRAANDMVSAEIRDCEIVNPNPMGVAADGPTGHGLLILTRNPARSEAPPPHERAEIAVRIERSIIRATGMGGAIFVINFAAHGKVSVTLNNNLVEGTLIASGGVSRPDLVAGSTVRLESQTNLYAPGPGSYDAIGWQLFGGSSSHNPGMAAPGASFNVLRLKSKHDRIEGFTIGIHAAAARRWQSASDLVSDNRVELELHGTCIQTDGEGAADFSLQGALSDAEADGNREFQPGNRNVLSILIGDATGSTSPRANQYANVFGPQMKANWGTGNRLEFAGSLADFEASNTNISVAPPAEFFRNE